MNNWLITFIIIIVGLLTVEAVLAMDRILPEEARRGREFFLGCGKLGIIESIIIITIDCLMLQMKPMWWTVIEFRIVGVIAILVMLFGIVCIVIGKLKKD